MLDLSIERIGTLLLIATAVAMLARRLRLPYTVGLVFAGTALAALSQKAPLALTREMIFDAFLPPLVFEASLFIAWKELRRDLLPITLLATVGVLISAVVTTLGMEKFAGWERTPALLFGVLIAATDPVSVIATFKDAGVGGRLRLLVEAESLLNDGTAAVFFVIALAVTRGAAIHVPAMGLQFVQIVCGGIVCGAIVGGAALMLAGKTEDHLIETAFTMIAAYGSFLLAEHFGWSGILSAMTAGLLMGNVGVCGDVISERGSASVGEVWEFIAFFANSLVFLLLGAQLAKQNFGHLLVPIAAAIIVIGLGRAAAVYSCCLVFARSKLRIPLREQHVLFWGGLRGALALALALGLPADTPRRQEIQTVAFAAVAFSIVAPGLTIKPLMRRLGLLKRNKE